ncbi:MAG: DUF4258 domain-containing protein [Bacillota bacterium]
MCELVGLLRKATRDSSYTISHHASWRMGLLGITVDDVERCLVEGVVVRKQDHGRNVKLILRGIDGNGVPFLMVAALSWPCPTIVTVMREGEDTT